MSIKKIALLGVDGTGKSTMAKELQKYLNNKDYDVRIIPFHHWVFADKLRTVFGKMIDKGRVGRSAPYSPPKRSFASFIKPPIAFIDNLFFLWFNSPRKKNQIFIYDRFVCATQIKFYALGYNVNWFKKLWISIKPDFAIIFDVDLDESVKRQIRRSDPYAYPIDILEKERNLYFEYAKKHNFPIIKSEDIEITKKNVLNEISKQVKIQ